jgi:glycosyltransferase involved in cell wall biosynthesis
MSKTINEVEKLNTNVLVSIVCPLYNKEPYFERCFNSIIKQTYTNIECIIIEDCSTDNSLELANRLIKSYNGNVKFILIKHEQNGGLSAARNTGINNSNGEYIYFLDSDDEITDNCINSLVTLSRKYPEVDIVQGNIYQYPRVENDDYELKGKLPEFVSGNLEIKKHYYMCLPPNAVNKLIRKKFITQNLYFKNGLIHEDFHWRFFMIKKLESFAFTDEYCYIRYIVSDSIMTNPNILPSILCYLTIAEDMLCNLDADLLEQQLQDIYWLLCWQKNRILSNEKYSSLMPKCEALFARIPKSKFFLFFIVKCELTKIKQLLKRIIKWIFKWIFK